MKAVHFGAGNIGRGFIGLLLSRSGFRVTFVDVNDTLVQALRERGAYTVLYAGPGAGSERVTGVDALHGADVRETADAVAHADLVTTAVGVGAFPHIAPAIAEGIRLRLRRNGPPLQIIACENAIGGSGRLQRYVYDLLTDEERQAASSRFAFPNAAVDRIVPAQHHEDPLAVTVEPFCEWVVERRPMTGAVREIEGVRYVDDLEPYIARKLFTVNTGHACAAYHGYLRGYATIQQAMADERLRNEVHRTLRETGAVLRHGYGLDEAGHEHYIRTTMERFSNPFLTDEVTRVGRSPIRKLSPDERFVRPAMLASGLGLETAHLANAMAAALRFDPPGDAEASELQAALREHGASAVISRYMNIPPEHPLHAQITDCYAKLLKEGGSRGH